MTMVEKEPNLFILRIEKQKWGQLQPCWMRQLVVEEGLARKQTYSAALIRERCWLSSAQPNDEIARGAAQFVTTSSNECSTTLDGGTSFVKETAFPIH